MKTGAASIVLVAAVAVVIIFPDFTHGTEVLDTSMTGPRRIERQSRHSGDRQGRTLDGISGVMDWEYGGWRPLQTPKGFYRRIARNLFRDDETKGINELDTGGDLEAASSSKSASFHALGLEDFLRSGPGCGDCGFQPLIFLHSRGPRNIRSTSTHTELEDAQILDSYREVLDDIRNVVKEKLRQKKLKEFLKRSKRSANNSRNTIPAETSTVNKLVENEPQEDKEIFKDGTLDQRKIDNIPVAPQETHYLSTKGILLVAKSIAEALAESTKREKTQEQQQQPKKRLGTTQVSTAKELAQNPKVEDRKTHLFSHEITLGTGKGLAESFARDLPSSPETEIEATSTSGKSNDEELVEAHFLSPKAVIGVAKGIAETLASKQPKAIATNITQRKIDEPHFLSPKSIFSLTKQVAKDLMANFPNKNNKTDRSETRTEQQAKDMTADTETHFLSLKAIQNVNKAVVKTLSKKQKQDEKTQGVGPASIKGNVEASTMEPIASLPINSEDAYFFSPAVVYDIFAGIKNVAAKTAQKETNISSFTNETKSRVRRQIWNPFRRRPAPPKLSIGGPFGFVNQNIPYEAQGSINSFSFSQNLPQSSSFQANDFPGIQPFVQSPPVTNFDKVNGPRDNHYPGGPSIGQHILPTGSDFASSSTGQFVSESVIGGPPPTRPVKRPEQVQPSTPTKTSSLPPPHVIDSLLAELHTTGQIPANLSPETALLLADILSGRKEHNSHKDVSHFSSPTAPVSSAIDVPFAEPPVPEPQIQIKPTKYHREPAPAPNFHHSLSQPLTSSPVSFGALPSPPKRSHQSIVRDKVVPATSHEVLYHHSHMPENAHVTVPHHHDGVHLNAEGFQRPHTVTRLRTRKRKKPLTSSTSTGPKLSLAEKAAEQAVEKDHTSVFPQEHVHIHHHHKRKRKRPTVEPGAKIPLSAPEAHLPDKIIHSSLDTVLPLQSSPRDIHRNPQHPTIHDPGHFKAYNQRPKLDAKIHLNTKSDSHAGSGELPWRTIW
ncbi:hypothetical protein BIW11_07155 [Tropilaelaps mercedesae]|uniref:Uncharacterized protein n=1 Tax=Tropilaelaps mercedesae TaxID=418985 RepID=A0A1V9XVG0_9ACAR|nr:hypothetical protein BIW11_07155 [Tropilaelaps mercedesae]